MGGWSRGRFPLKDLLWRGGIDVGMRLELEDQVQEINDEDDDACSSADLENPKVRFGLAAERSVEGCW